MKWSMWRSVSRVLTATCVLGSVLVASSAPAALDSAAPPPTGEVQVLRVTPEGKNVPATRQVVVTFDRPMAPIGDMLLSAEKSPASIEPAVNCHWHWLDPRSLACELDSRDALLPATEYALTVKAGTKAEDGNTLKQAFRVAFSTERPAVSQYSFKTWRGPGTPVVRLVFNQPVTRNSAANYLRFTGQQTSIVEPEPYDSNVVYVLPLPGEKMTLVAQAGAPPPANADEEKAEVGECVELDDRALFGAAE